MEARGALQRLIEGGVVAQLTASARPARLPVRHGARDDRDWQARFPDGETAHKSQDLRTGLAVRGIPSGRPLQAVGPENRDWQSGGLTQAVPSDGGARAGRVGARRSGRGPGDAGRGPGDARQKRLTHPP